METIGTKRARKAIFIGNRTEDPESPDDGLLWHRSDLNEFRFRVDNETKIVASLDDIPDITGYIHTQSVSSDTWNVNHGLNDSNPIIAVYSPDDTLVEPQDVSIVDENNLTVSFGKNVIGKVRVLASGGAVTIETIDYIVIKSVDDLNQFLDNDKYVLPPNQLVMLNGTINLDDKYIELSEGTVLRGLAKSTIISSNTGGVVRCSELDENVILREFTIVAPAGQCLDLSGPITHQLNAFFLGLIGNKAGTIEGFDVQAMKSCFINCNDGITLKGTTNKFFFDGCVFYGITAENSAITLDEGLNASVADIVTSFFKFDDGTCITAENGYEVGEGKIRGSLIDGDATPLDGLSPADIEWTMTDNSGVRDSRVAGHLSLDTQAATVVESQNTPVKVVGTTIPSTLNERFDHDNNRLTYKGQAPVLVNGRASFSIDSGNNVELTFFLAKNGSVISETGVIVKVGSGNDQRTGFVGGILEMEENDYVEVWGQNNDGTQNFTATSLTLTATA